MIDTFSAIYNKHETEDTKQMGETALFIAALKKEFTNSEEILDAATALSVGVQDFILGKVRDFPVIPVRNSEVFYIKKHTQSQVPYFHRHNFYEVLYVRKGKCLQKLDNGAELLLREKQCAVLSPETVHKIGKCGVSDIILKMVIPCKVYSETGGAVFGDTLTEGVKVFENLSETAEFAVLKLLDEQYKDNKFKNILIQSYLTIFFAEIAGHAKQDVALETELYRYFDCNVKTANISKFAAACGYNADYVSRLIKLKTGRSFSDLLSRYRINRAKELLLGGGMSVEDIAFEVGYSNASGLYKQFFAICGIRPAEYRKLFR